MTPLEIAAWLEAEAEDYHRSLNGKYLDYEEGVYRGIRHAALLIKMKESV